MTASPVTVEVVRGNPSPEQLGAVITLLFARSAAGTAPEPTAQRSLWAQLSQLQPRSIAHGPGAWRASGLPR